MKKLFLIVFVSIIISNLNSFCQSEKPVFKEGYQSAKWGMSPEEVKKVFSNKKFTMETNKGDISLGFIWGFEETILDNKAHISFSFYKNQLSAVSVKFQTVLSEENKQRNLAIVQFLQLLDVLEGKYGAISIEEEESLDIKSARWETKESTIFLSIHPPHPITPSILYTSKYFGNLNFREETAPMYEDAKNKL